MPDSSVIDDLLKLERPAPWCIHRETVDAYLSGQSSGAGSSELAAEVGPTHVLWGHAERAVLVAWTQGYSDDHVYFLPGGPASLAAVHLTFSGKRETSGDWPASYLFDDVASLREFL